ncbi:MAG: DUF3307 domain-containing protein [Verrucomicrobiales bacterium]|nr:DUF3307 domain-containing protein [Verrucomicrobiae bacterium]
MIANIGITYDAPWMLLFAMLIMHAIADFPLQGAFLAQGKNRHLANSEFQGEEPSGLWLYCLTAHSLIQAGGVWLVTGSAVIAAVEFLIHWLLDYAKCERWTNFHVDQLAHVLCKVGYVIYLSSHAS